MKTKFAYKTFLILLNFLLLNIVHSYAQSNEAKFQVATYNIRYDAVSDLETGNSWNQRKESLFDLIKRHDFDIFGTQEGMFKQMIDVKNYLSTYDYVSYPYGGKNDHHQNAIVYKRNLFEPLDAGVFWLSETPDIPSIGWDATDRRICNWVKFKHKLTGKVFFFFNAHFYWRNHEAKKQSGALIAKMIKNIAGNEPVICVGDFNSTSETDQISDLKKILNDSFEVSLNGVKGTLNTNLGGGNFKDSPINRIDYIMVSKNIKVTNYQVISDQYADNRYPSDHLPVSCFITF